jgi:prepilin-type N-terminal cleavage/methylation domain-containing protein
MSLRILRNQHGFTLTELLVACAMIGFVMAGLFSILRTGQQSYLTGMNQVEAQQGLRLALLRVTNEIREAGYCPTCSTLATGLGPFPAVINQSATGFTLQNDWDGTWNGTTGIAASGTVAQTVMLSSTSSTTATVNRGEQIIYSVSGGNLRRQENGLDASPVVVVSNLASIAFTYRDADGAVTATAANIRTITVDAVGQPLVQPTASTAGRVQVAMTDSVRLRNRAQ